MTAKRLVLLAFAVALAWWGAGEHGTTLRPAPADSSGAAAAGGADQIASAYAARRSDVPVEGSGVISRLLPDDSHGSRHQRFLLRTASGPTVLVAHNLDLAPRIAGLAVGAPLRFKGEYEWNDKGGVLHWTHRAPRGGHADGWIEYQGHRYE